MTRGFTKSEISSVPVKAPMNRTLDAMARVRDDGLITPSSEEYGTLITE